MTKTKTKNYKINENAKPFYYNTGSDCAVLFIHGFTDSLGNFKNQIEKLKELGISCMGVCLPGHGTHYRDLENYGPRDWLDCSEDALFKLVKNHKRVIVVGVSIGGNIAFDLAVRHPEKVSGIVSVGTPARLKKHYLTKFSIPLALPFYKYHRRKYPEKVREAFLKNGSYEYFPLKSVMKLIYYLERNKKELPRVKASILIIKIRNKRDTPLSSANYIFNHIGSKNKVLKTVYDYYFEKSKNKIFELAINFFELSNKFKEKKK